MSDVQKRVPTLPPTDQIKDPQARQFCDALTNMMELRNGNIGHTDGQRFITKDELDSFIQNKVLGMFGVSNVTTGPPGAGGPPPGFPSKFPEAVGILWRVLTEIIPTLTIPSVADLQSRTGEAIAGMLSEKTVRTGKDEALAAAINTIWAAIGDNKAIIQDGALAKVTPVAGSLAAQWTQVQAEVYPYGTTPGTPSSIAKVRQDMVATVDSDGNPQAHYAIRVDAGGAVGGFGLLAAGGTSTFGVIADTFWIAAPGMSSPTPQNTPFAVYTVSGQSYVYMNANVFIRDGDITNAKIGNYIQSNDFLTGVQGWRINKAGDAEFNNVTVRGTSTVGRLNVTGAVQGSVFVPNNTSVGIAHNSGRPVVVTVWSPQGAASLQSMDDNTFSVKVNFAGDATCFYSYF